HPPPLLYRAKTREWSFLDQELPEDPTDPRSAANVPLGILDLTEYEQFEVSLDPGDLVLCYTDSLIESRGPDGELLGTQRLLDLVRTLHATDHKAFIPSLLSLIERQYPNNLTEDDASVLLVRPTVD